MTVLYQGPCDYVAIVQKRNKYKVDSVGYLLLQQLIDVIFDADGNVTMCRRGVNTIGEMQFAWYIEKRKQCIVVVTGGDLNILIVMDSSLRSSINLMNDSRYQIERDYGLYPTYPTPPKGYRFSKDKVVVELGVMLKGSGIHGELFSIKPHLDIGVLSSYLNMWFSTIPVFQILIDIGNCCFNSTYVGEFFTYVHSKKDMTLTITKTSSEPIHPQLPSEYLECLTPKKAEEVTDGTAEQPRTTIRDEFVDIDIAACYPKSVKAPFHVNSETGEVIMGAKPKPYKVIENSKWLLADYFKASHKVYISTTDKDEPLKPRVTSARQDLANQRRKGI